MGKTTAKQALDFLLSRSDSEFAAAASREWAEDLKGMLEGALSRSIDAEQSLESVNADLLEALISIRDQEEHEIALDPDWPRRIARAAISRAEKSNG